jgi:hypothetical protein
MKTLVRIGALVMAASLVALLAGCASYSSFARGQPARDFDLVETSTSRQFTETEMAYMRAKVIDYLAQQGKTEAGDYYVKLNLGTELGVPEGEWVLVRYTRYPSATYSVASTYPTYSYPTYSYPAYGYSSLDYYPFGYSGFSSLSFRYYDYPYYSYYGSPGFYPPYYSPTWSGRRSYPRDHGRDYRDPKDRDRHDRDGERPRVGDRRPSGALKPSFVPSNVGAAPGNVTPRYPIGDHRRENRWDGRSTRTGDTTGTRRWSERPDRNGTNQRPAYTPPSAPTGGSTGAPAYRPATRSNLHRGDAGHSRSSGSESGTPRVRPSQPERSYQAPARSESPSPARYSSPRAEQSNSYSGRSESSGYSKDRTDGDTGRRRAGLEP